MKRLMPRLQAGMQIYHRGYPFELMYLSETTNGGEFWIVELLWKSGTSERFFARGDKIKMIMPTYGVMGACA